MDRKFWITAWMLLAASVGQAQTKRVYIAPDDHTDYFWSADENVYRQAFLDTLDYYLDLADSTAGNAPPYQSRWNCDGHLWMWTYEKNRTPEQFQRLIDRIADGHVSVPLNSLAINIGGAPMEAVLRGMYYPGRIERQHGLRFRLAYTMENQTQPLGLFSLWAGSGAKYSWKGICNCDTITPEAWDRQHDIYWGQGVDGGRVLMKWNSQLEGNQGMGGYAEARYPAAAVDFVTVNAPFNGFAARYPYDVIGCFGKGWDDLQTMTDEFVTTAIDKTDASRQVIVSNETDFFSEFEATYGSVLPSESCSYGNEWDLYCASLAEVTARPKRALEKLRAAEAMAAIVTAHDPQFMDGRRTACEQAWMGYGLFWEHNFGMVGPPTGSTGIAARIAWQRRLADEIDDYVDTLHDDASAALGDLISGGEQRFFAFNPLSWSRTDFADYAYGGPTSVHVVDLATDQEVPSQIVTRGAQTYLRVLAGDVPPVGYKVFEIRSGAGTNFGDAASVTGGGPGPTEVVYQIAANNRDAMSVRVGPPGSTHEVRISGYSVSEPFDFAGNDWEEESAGMEFAVNIPAGSTIVEAFLTVRAVSPSNPSPTGGMEVHLYDVANAAPFSNGALGDLLNHHPTMAQTVIWPAPAWNTGSDYSGPNLAALVQTFINRPDYVAGNHIGFVVTEGTMEANRYYGWSDLASGGQAARLTVRYTPPLSRASADASLVMDNGVNRVTVADRGAITSWIDLTRGNREFSQTIGGRVVNDLGAGTGTLAMENAGPVSVTVRAVASAPLQHTSRVTLYRNSDRIDLDNEITQNFPSVQTWAFGFNLSSPEVRHEEVGAILRARLASDGGHYCTRNARYDWLTLNHFADMSGGGDVGVTLSNRDCYFMQLGGSSVGTLDTWTPQIAVLAGGRVANGGNGLPSQGGDSLFMQRFSLRARDTYEQAAAMRFALEHQNPLVTGSLGGGAAPLPGDSFSTASVSNPSVLLWALKPAEDHPADGPVLRLWNLSDSPQSATVQWNLGELQSATAATHIETPEGGVPLNANSLPVGFGAQQLRTFMLTLTPVGPTVPTLSSWGFVGLATLLLSAGALLAGKRHPRTD